MKIHQFVLTFICIIFISLFLSTTHAADDFYIVYTANVNGMIENCGCGADPLGGIGRVKSYVDKFRQEHNDVIFIDGGDFFNSYPYPELNNAMFASLLLMHYDGIVPGDQVFVEGNGFFSGYMSKLNENIILSNSTSNLQKSLTKKIGSTEIQIFGYLSPYIFEFIVKPDQPILTNFVEARPKQAEKNDFQIAVVHGYLSSAQQFVEENPTIKLVLLAHDQRKGIWEKNQAKIIGNGKDSEYISVIKVSRKAEWQITVEQPKIHEDIPEDEQIVKIIEEFKNN